MGVVNASLMFVFTEIGRRGNTNAMLLIEVAATLLMSPIGLFVIIITVINKLICPRTRNHDESNDAAL